MSNPIRIKMGPTNTHIVSFNTSYVSGRLYKGTLGLEEEGKPALQCNWIGSYMGEERWKVTGEGAPLPNGGRAPQEGNPFSLSQMVNHYVIEFITGQLQITRDTSYKPPQKQIKKPVLPVSNQEEKEALTSPPFERVEQVIHENSVPERRDEKDVGSEVTQPIPGTENVEKEKRKDEQCQEAEVNPPGNSKLTRSRTFPKKKIGAVEIIKSERNGKTMKSQESEFIDMGIGVICGRANIKEEDFFRGSNRKATKARHLATLVFRQNKELPVIVVKKGLGIKTDAGVYYNCKAAKNHLAQDPELRKVYQDILSDLGLSQGKASEKVVEKNERIPKVIPKKAYPPDSLSVPKGNGHAGAAYLEAIIFVLVTQDKDAAKIAAKLEVPLETVHAAVGKVFCSLGGKRVEQIGELLEKVGT